MCIGPREEIVTEIMLPKSGRIQRDIKQTKMGIKHTKGRRPSKQ